MKKNVAFTLISFAVLKWDDCVSVQLPFELPVQVPVQLLELEPNWLVKNVIEVEFELSRMYIDETTRGLCTFLNINFNVSEDSQDVLPKT